MGQAATTYSRTQPYQTHLQASTPCLASGGDESSATVRQGSDQGLAELSRSVSKPISQRRVTRQTSCESRRIPGNTSAMGLRLLNGGLRLSPQAHRHIGDGTRPDEPRGVAALKKSCHLRRTVDCNCHPRYIDL